MAAKLKYSMKLRGTFPVCDYKEGDNGLSMVRSSFDKFDKWGDMYLCQEKLDGWYGIVVKKDGKCFWDNGWEQYGVLQDMLKVFDSFMPDDSIITGEVGYGTATETAWAEEHGYNRFIMFDVVRWDGEDFTGKGALERFRKIQEIWYQSEYWSLEFPQIDLVECSILDGTGIDNKQIAWEMFNVIYSKGGEGIVLKKHDSLYKIGKSCIDSYKVKKYLTKDYVCMGFVASDAPTYLAKGMNVASIKCGLYVDGELKEITQTSAFDFNWRKEFTDNPQKYVGKVVELGGYEIFKSGAMRHSMFMRFREDRQPEECIL